MTADMNCYDYPQYWDLAFSEDTGEEADFIEAAAGKYCAHPVRNLYEPGCGGGRLVVEMAGRGYHVTACDTSQPSLDYLTRRLTDRNLAADLTLADMTDFRPERQIDVAFNTMNTFRHLLSEEAARTHLQTVAAMLRPGGLYIIGLHLLPPDADEDDSEHWTVQQDDVSVALLLEVVDFSRSSRLEQLRFELDVRDGDTTRKLISTYTMRIYMADQMQSLLESVPELELCDVYDFWYDITEPLPLDDRLGDAVFVLRRRL